MSSKVPYLPTKLPLETLDWVQLIPTISETAAAVALYDGELSTIPNPDILLSPLMTQEAVLSSRIEGTQATAVEVMEFEADPKARTKRYADIQEVINYRSALRKGQRLVTERPMRLESLKSMHHTLLRGVRGQNKARGRFRTTQNWIGKGEECKIEDATYVPPHPLEIDGFLTNWERYYHHEEKDPFVQMAILHAQFELIHPFLDGNGRIGRLIIPLFLFEKKRLRHPSLYVSAYLERTRKEYYTRLLAISEEGDWNGWIEYFLRAVRQQATANTTKVDQVRDLYDSSKEQIPELTRSRYAIQTIDPLFMNPIFGSRQFIRRSSIPEASAMRILKRLEEEGVVSVVRRRQGRAPAIYSFPKLIDIIGL